MRRLLALAVALAALLVAADASAKTCARVTFAPEHPRARVPVELRLSTWQPRWRLGKPVYSGPLVLPPSYRLELLAIGPDATTVLVRLRRDESKPHVWRARVAFTRPGMWQIESPELWANAPRGCSPARAVRVG